MHLTLRSGSVLAALAAIFAGLTLSGWALVVADDAASRASMPANGCPPSC